MDLASNFTTDVLPAAIRQLEETLPRGVAQASFAVDVSGSFAVNIWV